MAKMPVSVAKSAHPETPTATIVMKKESSKIDLSKTETIIANPKDPPVDKGDKPKSETIIIAKPKGPFDEEVPTKFVPLGAIITDGDEINFHRDLSIPRKKPPKTPIATAKKQVKTLEPIRRVVKNDKNTESADQSAQAAQMKELRLLSFGKKLLDSCKSGNAGEVKKFMLEGAPFIADWVGTTPLHYSVMNKHVEVTELLLNAGICKDAKNKVDRTPLHVAAHMGLAYMVKLLLSYGADVNCRDMLNMTPLHWAAESGDLLTAKILLDYGADTSVVNKFGKTAFQLADKNNFADVLREIAETDKLHPDERMIKVSHLQRTALSPSTNRGMFPVAEILEPKPSDIKKLGLPAMMKKVVLVAKENPEGGVYRGAVNISSDIDSDDDFSPPKNDAGEMSADSALKLLKSHGVRMIEPDKDTVVSSAVLNGHTIRLTDAGKLAFKSLEKNLEIDKLTSSEPVLSPEPNPSKNDRTSPDLEGPPSKMQRLSNGQKMHQISAEQLIEMKNVNKFVIKGSSLPETSLPECTIDLSEPIKNGTSDINQPGIVKDIDDSMGGTNAIYLQRMENKANLCLKQINALKRQIRIKEDEYTGIRKQIEMFKTCSKLT
uniref:GA-binding protein subunit beta-1 n=1 Tax=Lygus hesperus TaxID=30085 RepID=A0A146L6X4_LYGHE